MKTQRKTYRLQNDIQPKLETLALKRCINSTKLLNFIVADYLSKLDPTEYTGVPGYEPEQPDSIANFNPWDG